MITLTITTMPSLSKQFKRIVTDKTFPDGFFKNLYSGRFNRSIQMKMVYYALDLRDRSALDFLRSSPIKVDFHGALRKALAIAVEEPHNVELLSFFVTLDMDIIVKDCIALAEIRAIDDEDINENVTILLQKMNRTSKNAKIFIRRCAFLDNVFMVKKYCETVKFPAKDSVFAYAFMNNSPKVIAYLMENHDIPMTFEIIDYFLRNPEQKETFKSLITLWVSGRFVPMYNIGKLINVSTTEIVDHVVALVNSGKIPVTGFLDSILNGWWDQKFQRTKYVIARLNVPKKISRNTVFVEKASRSQSPSIATELVKNGFKVNKATLFRIIDKYSGFKKPFVKSFVRACILHKQIRPAWKDAVIKCLRARKLDETADFVNEKL